MKLSRNYFRSITITLDLLVASFAIDFVTNPQYESVSAAVAKLVRGFKELVKCSLALLSAHTFF
jgi:hypothetical protein